MSVACPSSGDGSNEGSLGATAIGFVRDEGW